MPRRLYLPAKNHYGVGTGGEDPAVLRAETMSHTWADTFRTYEDACIYYGADTPAQIEAELEHDSQQEAARTQDELEAWGGAAARSHANGVEHARWCAEHRLPEPTDREWVRTVLWGQTPARDLPTDPVVRPAGLDLDDDIPF